MIRLRSSGFSLLAPCSLKAELQTWRSGRAAHIDAKGRIKSESPSADAGAFASLNPGDDLLSRVVANAVPSALEGLTSVFGMGTGVTPPPKPPETQKISGYDRVQSAVVRFPLGFSKGVNFMVKPHDRLVLVSFVRCRTSTPSLSPGSLPGVFSPPKGKGYLISGWVSRLYAFSVYPVRT